MCAGIVDVIGAASFCRLAIKNDSSVILASENVFAKTHEIDRRTLATTIRYLDPRVGFYGQREGTNAVFGPHELRR
jgi:hypothetical protein